MFSLRTIVSRMDNTAETQHSRDPENFAIETIWDFGERGYRD